MTQCLVSCVTRVNHVTRATRETHMTFMTHVTRMARITIVYSSPVAGWPNNWAAIGG
jgi:hypothetical protein